MKSFFVLDPGTISLDIGGKENFLIWVNDSTKSMVLDVLKEMVECVKTAR